MSFFSDLLQFQFLQYALIAAILCSIISGVMGTFVVIRRSTYVAGAVAHCALGGIGFASWASATLGWSWLSPTVGALLAAIIAAITISLTRASQSEREDTIMSVIWALGMALGISFMIMTPGYAQDLSTYLFGDVLLLTSLDLYVTCSVVIVVILFIWRSFDRLVATSFNAQLAELKGINPKRFDMLFTLITALTIVVLVRLVGIVLVIALLTIPAATAARISSRIISMILTTIAISASSMLLGLWIAYQWNLPAGPTMIELSVLIYAIVFLFTRNQK